MFVKKTTSEIYEIRKHGEYANISLREWSKPELQQFGGEMMVHSSFGSWAYTWGATGQPFKHFLARLTFDYMMGKLMGPETEVFDAEASIKNAMKELIQARRDEKWDKDAVREAYNELGEHLSSSMSQADFGYICRTLSEIVAETADENGCDNIFYEPHYMMATKVNPQAKGFWEHLWPEFVATIKKEIESARPEAEAKQPRQAPVPA